MKNIKKIGFILVASALSFASCTKDLDINRSPYNPVENDASPELLFPSGVAYSAAKIGGDLQLMGAMWSQHYTQNNSSNQYTGIDSYNLTISSYNGIWSNLMGGGMKDLLISKEKAATAGLWNFYAASEIMLAFDYHVLVDLYGDLPVIEGLQGDKGIYTPKWDDGKTVNKLIVEQLDDAISKIESGKPLKSMGAQDFLFDGDLDNWHKFANTLKLKVLMRDFTANTAAITSLLNGGNLLDTDAKMTAFLDAVNKSNPLFESDRRALNTFANLRASKTLLSYLQKNNDPRIEDFFELTTEQGKPAIYAGLRQGDYNASTTDYPPGSTSRAKLGATDAVYFMSYAESEFLQAEAWARLNNAGKAKTHYDLAVSAAFSRWSKSATTFIAGGVYEFKAGTVEKMIEQIITQKWVAATRCQAWDSFYDQNRTGYPVMSTLDSDDPAYIPGQYTRSITSVLIGQEIPRRLPYPKISSDNNANTPKAVAINAKMWWHKQ
ncbi:hypothetical protein KO02_04875 [Sphingobacterium sp. ML3W]|uniref:SusD/RagB family nutrient-binding outer membrane lipoprotein n=1 Tax=Sphingobacterium sp. ML3W TaxID=1538644 RepID=UPI0004F7BDA2|nr:SusD/RagB family nutrient-binding outer membrane lipoprotein [Sphingobacterium sp. ML3W]AIM36100.1 hypothetical protein KO02_04875 [Sphingobacterium sp. ML3W]